MTVRFQNKGEEVQARFIEVFQEPKRLPPQGTLVLLLIFCQGKVRLVFTPYTYSSLHKDEIQRYVQYLLQNRITRNSNSTYYSSPTILEVFKLGCVCGLL